MSTRDEIAHAVDLFGSAMHDLAITHYKGEVTQKDLAVYTRRRLELINLFAPPTPGEVTIRLKRHDAQKALDALNYGISDWVRFHGSAEDIDWMVAERDAIVAALEAATPEQS